mmetsp:Transcript_7174/g.15161  ORF Transcript_7174/g.15161 Transcript_7174/m.15161 type:complete len:250 (-) Transcript_7174:361-1110(-)
MLILQTLHYWHTHQTITNGRCSTVVRIRQNTPVRGSIKNPACDLSLSSDNFLLSSAVDQRHLSVCIACLKCCSLHALLRFSFYLDLPTFDDKEVLSTSSFINNNMPLWRCLGHHVINQSKDILLLYGSENYCFLERFQNEISVFIVLRICCDIMIHLQFWCLNKNFLALSSVWFGGYIGNFGHNYRLSEFLPDEGSPFLCYLHLEYLLPLITICLLHLIFHEETILSVVFIFSIVLPWQQRKDHRNQSD